MKPIWRIDSANVIALQSRDLDFARFVNDLLAAQAQQGGVAVAALRLNLKTQAPDGGVDAAVDQPVPGDPTGWLAVPTCWQFKASPTRNIKPPSGQTGGQEAALRAEINLPYARELIRQGYGHRFCIADDMPPSQVGDWEGWLLDEACKIKADAPHPKVLSASALAHWASFYSGLVRLFRPELAGVLALRQWAADITRLTRTFIPVAAWKDAFQAIQTFADFVGRPNQAVMAVSGEAGVGKTRCVYEALASSPVYEALIVADECGLSSRVRLERLLASHANRLRVIAIDNALQEEQLREGEARLRRIASEEVEAILAANFSALTPERRRAFAGLAEGFVRLAIDLCEREDLIPADGNVGSVLAFFRDHYLGARLSDEELAAVQVVSLLLRVGHQEDVASQLEGLCRACPTSGLTPARVQEIAGRLKQAPGFIAVGQRYL